MTNELKCCVELCEKPLDQTYWEKQYQDNTTGWDLGQISPPLKTYFDSLSNKELNILIPGCGNTYEAEYLLQNGFKHITVIDLSPTLTNALQEKFKNNPEITVICGDFFNLKGSFDVIVEQTFFCALAPQLRPKYVWKMYQLLSDNGKLAGLLFDHTFEQGPPFGGSKAEYEKLFSGAFKFNKIESCINSIEKRSGTELIFEFEKVMNKSVVLYHFNGITCNGCRSSITQTFAEIPKVENVEIASNFEDVLIVSKEPIDLFLLQNAVAYDSKYSIESIG